MACVIPLTKGYEAIVDDIDVDVLSRWKWQALVVSDSLIYARTTEAIGGGKYRDLLMHRLILPLPFKLVVDHIDGNGLNNVRSNLRPASHRENIWASRRHRGASSTGFIGVSLDKRGRYRAYVGANGKREELGSFATAEEAALVRDAAARRLHGQFAYLNFPDEESADKAAARRLG
jgi:hypothetical protein